MSTQQVDRLQALLTRVQENRGKPREIVARASNGAPAPAFPQAMPADMPAMQAPAAFARNSMSTSMQDGIDTTPPPAAMPVAPAAAAPSVQRGPARGPTAPSGFDRSSGFDRMGGPSEPATSKVSRAQLTETGGGRSTDPRVDAPSPRRGAQPGSTPLEMALEGEVARVAAQAPEMVAPESIQGRVLADPTPPTPSKPIAQAVTKHPPVTGATFGDVLRRSLALRPR